MAGLRGVRSYSAEATHARYRDPLGDLFVVYNYDALDSDVGGWGTESSQLLVKLQYALRC